MDEWHIYMVRCGDGCLYTGISKEVVRRFQEHQEEKGKGAKFLRGRSPLSLVFLKKIGNHGLALKVERAIKKLAKKHKESVVQKGTLPDHIASLCSSEVRS